MDGQVRSRLLLLQPRARYQRVAVHRVAGLHHTYDVLFLGTSKCPRRGGLGLGGRGCGAVGLSAVRVPGDGRLHKAVGVGPRVHIVEELQIFSPGQPVQNLLLDASRVSWRRSPGSTSGCPSLPISGPQPASPWRLQDGKFQSRGMSQRKVGCPGA